MYLQFYNKNIMAYQSNLVQYIRNNYHFSQDHLLLQNILPSNPQTAGELFLYMYQYCLATDPDASPINWSTFGIIVEILNNNTNYNIIKLSNYEREYIAVEQVIVYVLKMINLYI